MNFNVWLTSILLGKQGNRFANRREAATTIHALTFFPLVCEKASYFEHAILSLLENNTKPNSILKSQLGSKAIYISKTILSLVPFPPKAQEWHK